MELELGISTFLGEEEKAPMVGRSVAEEEGARDLLSPGEIT